tara:strand:- start:8660 stop:8821 length:162 start_codon:yes stop_codon:yes gene_type:complete
LTKLFFSRGKSIIAVFSFIKWFSARIELTGIGENSVEELLSNPIIRAGISTFF